MFERNILDSQLLTMNQVCRASKIKPDTLHSIKRRHHLLPNGIVVSKHVKDPKSPFKTVVKGREVLYSGRIVQYVNKIMDLKMERFSYNKISARKDIVEEQKLIEQLHEANIEKDPLNKDDDFFNNFHVLIEVLARRVEGSDLVYYKRLSKDARKCFQEYRSVNIEIEDRAYIGNFEIEDLLEKKYCVASRLGIFYGMMKAILNKIGELVEKDSGFRKEVIGKLKENR